MLLYVRCICSYESTDFIGFLNKDVIVTYSVNVAITQTGVSVVITMSVCVCLCLYVSVCVCLCLYVVAVDLFVNSYSHQP